MSSQEESEVPGRESRRSNWKDRGFLRTVPPLEAFHKVPEFPLSPWVNALLALHSSKTLGRVQAPDRFGRLGLLR